MDIYQGFYRLLRACLGGTFVVAGSLKLMAPRNFAVLIQAFGVVPDPLTTWVAVLLTLLEVGAGAALLFDIRGSLLVVTALLVLFTALLGYAIRLGLDVDCGCFGPGDPEAAAFHGLRQALFRDLLMLAVAVSLYAWRLRRAIRPVRVSCLIQNLKRGAQ